MKRTAIISSILLAVALTVVAGCDPTLNTEDGVGRKVKFSASSQASPSTKTVYGAMDGSTWQTISWQSGDKIRIYSPAGGSISGTTVPTTSVDPVFDLEYVYADYTIAAFENQGHVSKASLENVDPNGLTWTGSADAVFYGAYPGDRVSIATNTGNQLRFAFKVYPGNYGSTDPNAQDGNPAGVKEMPMLSMAKIGGGQDVEMDFYPAFSAFEVDIKSEIDDSFTIDWVELCTDGTGFQPLTGLCYYDLNQLPAGATESGYPHFLQNSYLSTDNPGSSIKINLGATVSKTQAASFTFFTLPYTHTGLMLRVHSSKTNNGGTEESEKVLRLKKSGNWISFPAGHKAKITGVVIDPDLWCFSTIILNTSLIWELGSEPSTASNVNPEASQFAITGEHIHNMYQRHNSDSAYKPYRQRWILNGVDSTATVSFKIMSPRGGTYTVTPQGDTADFDIVGTLTGNIAASGAATKVSFTVTPKESAIGTTKKVWFTTTVADSEGTVFSIDSETQLYDMRGYHYFMTTEQTGTL